MNTMANKTIHEGHRERLRQRILSSNIDSLEPHEVIEFLLYYAIPRQNVNTLAHALLNRYGSLINVFQADIEDMMQIKGMGAHAAQWIYLVGECVLACGKLTSDDYLKITNFQQVISIIHQMKDRICAPGALQFCLGREERLLYCNAICQDANWGEADVLRRAMSDVFSSNSRYVILAVLTEDEEPHPSQYDIQHARYYANALALADKTLLDIILIGSKKSCSMRRSKHVTDPRDSGSQRILRENYLDRFYGVEDAPYVDTVLTH